MKRLILKMWPAAAAVAAIGAACVAAAQALSAQDTQESGRRACAEPPASMIAAPDALIDRAPRIVIATPAPYAAAADGDAEDAEKPTLDRERAMRRATQGDGPERITLDRKLMRFRVLENIKGDGPEEIYLAAASAAPETAAFDGHGDERFWRDPAIGRARIGPDCRIIASFEEGRSYVIFTGPPHVKSYEALEGADDAWLAYIRERLAGGE